MVPPRGTFVTTTKVSPDATCGSRAYSIIERRGAEAVATLAAPLASPVRGAESLRTSRAFRNIFRRGSGWRLGG
jgi:hypothetical protein